MDLIEELKNYCDINNPVGALMLSGEWGCGKTYLINTKFIPLVKDTYVFVCVSLFGIDSLDALRVEVKKKWLEKASELDKLNGTKVSKITDSYKKIFGTIKDILPENWQKKGEVISSIMDLVNFMPISNRMFEKKVILVFDDLERSNISSTDLLGCINDYCENQSFNTIIVANEEKIKGISKKMESHYQKVGIVKYDAFHEMGGNLSFALTMLDENDNGWIFNAMHSREGCYTYIKEIVKGESYIELSEEEQQCLEKAIYQEEYDIKDMKE